MNPLQKIAYFYILTLPEGHFEEKIKKKTFLKVVGRKRS